MCTRVQHIIQRETSHVHSTLHAHALTRPSRTATPAPGGAEIRWDKHSWPVDASASSDRSLSSVYCVPCLSIRHRTVRHGAGSRGERGAAASSSQVGCICISGHHHASIIYTQSVIVRQLWSRSQDEDMILSIALEAGLARAERRFACSPNTTRRSRATRARDAVSWRRCLKASTSRKGRKYA